MIPVLKAPPAERLRHFRAWLAGALLVGLSACGGSSNPAGDSSPSDPAVVHIQSGAVRGVLADGVYSFKGIPYAKPPVGSLRWVAPQPPDSWAGERLADSFGPHCAQVGLTTLDFSGSEDCLFINVWSPQRNTTDLLPVFVYLHGGGNLTGSGDFDLGRMASLGPAIMVTLNYRLGPFGFLAHPAFAAENSHHSAGNYAILDQIAALKWLQQNIRSFGGDPARVLLSGSSAGAHDTSVLVASPLARGLFSAAGLISHTWTVLRPSIVANTARVAARFLRCDAANDLAACLRSRTAAEVATLPGNGSANLSWDPSCLNVNAGLGCQYNVASVDGYVLPDTPRHIVRAGSHNAVPAIIGSTSLEMTTSALAFGLQNVINDETTYQGALRAEFPTALADATYRLYPSSSYGSPLLAYIVAEGDIRHHCPARNMLDTLSAVQRQPVWEYLWDHTWSSGPNRELGAGHGTDLPFIFQTYSPGSLTPLEVSLSLVMSTAWHRFAASHNPESSGMPWPPYGAANPLFKAWETPTEVRSGWRHHECDVLEAVGFDWEWFGY